MKISILGLGWFGLPLAQNLLKVGHDIYGSTRSTEKKEKLEGYGVKVSLLNFPHPPDREIVNSEVTILNIPPFEEELNWFKSWDLDPNTWMIFISSTSKKEVLLKQEDWIQRYFKTWTILRFGGLYGDDRHPGKYLAGKKNLPGRLWPVRLLEQSDAISFTEEVINNKIQYQVLDVYQKTKLTREEFYINYCKENNLKLPSFDPNDDSISREIRNF